MRDLILINNVEDEEKKEVEKKEEIKKKGKKKRKKKNKRGKKKLKKKFNIAIIICCIVFYGLIGITIFLIKKYLKSKIDNIENKNNNGKEVAEKKEVKVNDESKNVILKFN